VCGTDTLGVGINVPIRTVLLTSLVKFDGERMRHLTAREFHQIAGRAGRAGYDTVGEVLVMAPDHVIENKKLLEKAGDDPKKLKKIVRKKAPVGHVNWTDSTFERLVAAPPEPLTSQFSVSHAMILNVLARTDEDGRPVDPVNSMRHLLLTNHDQESRKREHIRQTFRIYRSLRQAGIVEKVKIPTGVVGGHSRYKIQLAVDVPDNFALNQPLSPFAVAAMDLLGVDSPTHGLDVLSVIESTMEDPRQVLYGQERAAKSTAIAEMKAEGVEYDQRMELLEGISWPKPLEELLQSAFHTYKHTNPWVSGMELSPKSVVRDFLEKAQTFSDFISRYQLERSEGVVLKYLADTYRTMTQTVPVEHRTDEVEAITEWLGELVRSVDSSLLDEWERLANPDEAIQEIGPDFLEDEPIRAISGNPRTFNILLRNAMFHRVELLSREDYDAFDALAPKDGWNGDDWADAVDPMFEEYGDDAIGIGPDARAPQLLQITRGVDGTERMWQVRQVLDDPNKDHDWAITALVDLDRCDGAGEVLLSIQQVGPST
jgi:hypothetical protein